MRYDQSMKKLPHPIQYQGSKRNLANDILRFFPEDVGCLIEPFAGSAAISVASTAHQLAKSCLINDVNKPLVELLKLMVESPADTADCYEQIWLQQQDDSVGHYYQVREQFNKTQDARLFLYLLARCVKGAVRYNSEGLFNQSPDKRRRGTRPATMRNNILGFSRLLQGKCTFMSIDYREVLPHARPNDLVYMDPPYQGVCGKRDTRYFSGIDHDGFVMALRQLNARNISYMVSYDGRRGDKAFGELLPADLQLVHVELEAGRSSQSTLLGKQEVTYESLYLSPALKARLKRGSEARPMTPVQCYQYALLVPSSPRYV